MALKTIGLLGGMSWESTAQYYRLINEGVKARLGGLHSAAIALVSVDFHDIEALQHRGDWKAAGKYLARSAQQVEAAGADFLVLCTNTMHKVAPAIEAAIQIPLLHIADATATAIQAQGIQTVGLLGTQFTMEQDFYRGRLTEKFGLDVQIPAAGDRATVHRIIYEELCLGIIQPSSRDEYRRIVRSLVTHQGVGGVIAGCTEIPLLMSSANLDVPLFDTLALHAQAAVEWALADPL